MANNGTSTKAIDGIHRYSNNGIKVIITGAGIGGLSTALECWRKGCEVVVLERLGKLSMMGKFFHFQREYT
jgi:thioredoxin reductase